MRFRFPPALFAAGVLSQSVSADDLEVVKPVPREHLTWRFLNNNPQLNPKVPADAAKVLWAEGYPKAVPVKAGEKRGKIEVFGDYKVKDGWAVREVELYFVPKGGGPASEPVDLKFVGGRWGAPDFKDLNKVIPARIPIGVGVWNVNVTFLLEGKDATGQPATALWAPPTAYVEVK